MSTMLPEHIFDRIMMSESGWVFLPANDCGWYDEYALRAIADELERRNAVLFADLEDDASF